MGTDYIVINEGASGLNKRFEAIAMLPRIQVTKTIEPTIGGKRDVTYGGVYESCRYVLRVPAVSEDTDYGTYEELRTMLKRNNPFGTPGTVFTFTDHTGTAFANSLFAGDMVEIEPLTTIVEGTEAWFIVPIEILLPTS